MGFRWSNLYSNSPIGWMVLPQIQEVRVIFLIAMGRVLKIMQERLRLLASAVLIEQNLQKETS